jgi:hypothetical protein
LSRTTISPVSPDPELNEEVDSFAAGAIICEERLETPLAVPLGMEGLGGAVDTGRRLRWWWKRFRRTEVVPMLATAFYHPANGLSRRLVGICIERTGWTGEDGGIVSCKEHGVRRY